MATQDEHSPVLTPQEARQGKELGVMRWVLYVSLGLCVLAAIVLWAIFG